MSAKGIEQGTGEIEIPRKLARRSMPLLEIPKKVFDRIAGFLDSSSLLQLAKADKKLHELVGQTRKHWKEVQIFSDCCYIDYHFFQRSDADFLLSNARIENYNASVPPSKRGLLNVPNELLNNIFETLNEATKLHFGPIDPCFAVFTRNVAINDVLHKPGEFTVNGNEYEPIWKMQNQDGTWNTLERVSLLEGRHVKRVQYELPDGIGLPDAIKISSAFTCEDLYIWCHHLPKNVGDTAYLDADLVQNRMQPKNILSAIFLDCLVGPDFPKGSLRIEEIDYDGLHKLKTMAVPRLALGPLNPAEAYLKLILDYIDEWNGGQREIETLWIIWEVASLKTLTSDFDIAEDLRDGALAALVSRWNLGTAFGNVFRGRLKRADGKILRIRARREEVVLESPGAKTLFLNRHYRDRKPAYIPASAF